MQTLEKHAFPVLAHMRVDQIQRQDILRVLTPIWTTRMETARRVRHCTHAVFAWCESRGFVGRNLAGEAIDGALPKMPQVQNHLRALPYADVAQALRTIASGAGSNCARLCLRFTVLTAVRSREARYARWNEVDRDKRLWVLPPLRTKTATEHRQPLSTAALEVLDRAKALDDGSGLIFPSRQCPGKPLSDATLLLVLKSNGLADRATVHGFRSSFRTWASECTNAQHAVMELSIGHTVGSQVERAYERTDLIAKRRDLMERWAQYVCGDPRPGPNE